MTLSVPFTLPDTATCPHIAGRRPAPDQQLARPRLPVLALVSLPGHGSQPIPPGRPADRSGRWLRNAAAGLCVLAAAAAAVSFTAFGGLRYRNCLNVFQPGFCGVRAGRLRWLISAA
jgi:hypothetical protein